MTTKAQHGQLALLDSHFVPEVLPPHDYSPPHPPELSTISEGSIQNPSTLDILISFEGLLRTYGRMNQSANFQNRVMGDNAYVLTKKMGHHVNKAHETSTTTKHNKLKEEALEHIAGMIGSRTLLRAGIITERQAAEKEHETYSYYTARYQGLDPVVKARRSKALNKTQRRIAKKQKTQ